MGRCCWLLSKQRGHSRIRFPALSCLPFPLYSVSCIMHVLEACLIDNACGYYHKLKVWQRTIKTLNNHPWKENAHASPFFVYQLMVDVFFKYMSQFTTDLTELPNQALHLILKKQLPSGGFSSFGSMWNWIDFTREIVESTIFSGYFSLWKIQQRNSAAVFSTKKNSQRKL